VGRLSRVILPGLLLLGLYYAFFGGRYSLFELLGAQRERAEAELELRRLQQENDSLRAWADSLASDPRVLERFAREELGMTLPNEVLYRFDDPSDADTPPDSAGDGGRGTP